MATARAEVFHKEGDYAAFVDLLAAANERLPMRILGYVLMPNHFHLVLWPHAAGDLSRWMQWLLTSHVRRYHRHYHSSGHVWQGRFKAFPIEQDEHLLTVLRYVERNPLRAGLVERAEDWHVVEPGVANERQAAGDARQVADRLPARLDRLCQRPQTEAEVLALRTEHRPRHTLRRGSLEPAASAKRLGLESSLRPRGRPRKTKK